MQGIDKLEEIGEKLEIIEKEILKGNFSLRKLGFWDIVIEAKLNDEIAKRYGKKIAEINRYVFEKKWKRRYSISFGISLLSLISIIFIALYFFVYNHIFYLSLYFPIASFVLSASLHPITQYIVGRIFGIKFIYIYLRGLYIFSRSSKGKIHIEPALKLDYESYLKVHPMKRAIMHVSGTFVTLFIVFFFFILSLTYPVELFSKISCGMIAISYLLTEMIYSPRYAAWKHFREEYRIWKSKRIRSI